MTPAAITEASTRAQIVRNLQELVAAIDRRVPQVEHVGEISIARAASALKLEALKRIEELKREAPPAARLSYHSGPPGDACMRIRAERGTMYCRIFQRALPVGVSSLS
jgi:hypothetical protein